MNTLFLAALLAGVSVVGQAAVEDDLATTARVRTALQADLGTHARRIRVDSYGGTVQLSGSVVSQAVGRQAVMSATDVDGVNHVQNELIEGPVRGVLTVD